MWVGDVPYWYLHRAGAGLAGRGWKRDGIKAEPGAGVLLVMRWLHWRIRRDGFGRWGGGEGVDKADDSVAK